MHFYVRLSDVMAKYLRKATEVMKELFLPYFQKLCAWLE
jgi:hypothetical protein